MLRHFKKFFPMLQIALFFPFIQTTGSVTSKVFQESSENLPGDLSTISGSCSSDCSDKVCQGTLSVPQKKPDESTEDKSWLGRQCSWSLYPSGRYNCNSWYSWYYKLVIYVTWKCRNYFITLKYLFIYSSTQLPWPLTANKDMHQHLLKTSIQKPFRTSWLNASTT